MAGIDRCQGDKELLRTSGIPSERGGLDLLMRKPDVSVLEFSAMR
jgi:hypothetical protein